jgi:titin
VTEFEDTNGTTGLTAGTKYYYRIRALPQLAANGTADDDAGWSAMNTSDATSATTHGDTPRRPIWPAAEFTPTASSLVVVWEELTGANTGGSAITGYELRIWSGGRWVTETTTAADVTTYTDMNLAAGTKYYYIVRAINSQGAGLWSGYKAGTTTAATPDAPELTATATGMNVIRLTWTVPNDNGMAIEGYMLQRWNPAATPAAAWDTANLLGTDNNKVLYLDSELTPGTTYHYRIRALPQGDDDDAGWSMIKSDTTDAGAPSKPVLTATADGSTAIDLSWDAPPANGSAIIRYELERWDTTNRRWDPVRNNLPSTLTSYEHSGLTADTRYVYRLRGVNRAADNGGLGQWSTIVFQSTE